MDDFKIVFRLWQPKDLIDDLQLMIDEEPDSYLNGRLSTLCSARDYLKSFFGIEQEPLAIEELREMDGEPAYFVSLHDSFSGWGIIRIVEMSKTWFIAVSGAERTFGDKDNYGKTWLAYRHKPMEGDK